MKIKRLFKVALAAVSFGGFVWFVGCDKENPEKPIVPVTPQDTIPVNPQDTIGKDTVPIIPELEYVDKVKLLQLVNNYRSSGCNCTDSDYYAPTTPVIWNDTLALAADDHSLDMSSNNFFSHTGSDSSNAGNRITRRGYTWKAYGENIAKGYKNEEAVVNGWINSPGHCKNIMSPNFKEMGVARRGNYWTQVFGTRK
jgi:uncharacterized protein YkwD